MPDERWPVLRLASNSGFRVPNPFCQLLTMDACTPTDGLVWRPDYTSAVCMPTSDAPTPIAMSIRAPVNAIDPAAALPSRHLSVFSRYDGPWRGSPPSASNGLLVDFLGFNASFAIAYTCGKSEPMPSAGGSGRAQSLAGTVMQTAWPVVSEEYWEYADVLDAAADDFDRRRKAGPTTAAARPPSSSSVLGMDTGASQRIAPCECLPAGARSIAHFCWLTSLTPGFWNRTSRVLHGA